MTNNKSVTDGPASLDLLEEAPPCFASIEQVSVRQNVILNKFHLDFPSNSVIAIMGPSGSGMYNGAIMRLCQRSVFVVVVS